MLSWMLCMKEKNRKIKAADVPEKTEKCESFVSMHASMEYRGLT